MKAEIKPDGFLHVIPETEFEVYILTWWCNKNAFTPDWPNLTLKTEKLEEKTTKEELEETK